MFTTRRLSGNLAQEEFWSVSLMSWFHLTLDFNSPIVLSLRAEGSSPEERLFKIAQRVNLPAHKMAKNFFDIADAISRIFTQIETGIYNTAAAAPALYTPGPIQDDIRLIITHWSLTTGRDLRAQKVRPA
jgi:hypothetical protein